MSTEGLNRMKAILCCTRFCHVYLFSLSRSCDERCVNVYLGADAVCKLGAGGNGTTMGRTSMRSFAGVLGSRGVLDYTII